MKNLKCLYSILTIVFVLACLYTAASGQTTEDKSRLAAINGNGSSVRWDVAVPNAGLTLIVSAPDGRVFSKNFKGGSSPNFSIADAQGERLPDGQYTYELRLASGSSPARKDVTSNGRGKDDEPEAVRAARKSLAAQPLVESGSFSIVNGSVVVAGSQEPSATRSASKSSMAPQVPEMTLGGRVSRKLHHTPFMFMPDDVIPDDLIVQGSACVGLDCVNGEVFGFDTVRLKENNTRLQFDDTSTSAGFPTNNWQIRANSSASGGASFLGFVDQGATGNSETGTIVFEVDAGAPANAVKVSSTGKVGFRTATPVLDLHITTSDTPAHRLEQTNAGGFTAQTWDIAGNEANFFVRDVTGGSRLPFRIRPGAPTSSIDISASGNVGIGTASPTAKLDVSGTIALTGNSFANGPSVSNNQDGLLLVAGTTLGVRINNQNNSGELLRVTNAGNVGIGTAAPDQKLSVNGEADKTGGNTWLSFSDERLKNIKGRFNLGLKAVMQLQPIRYEYSKNNALGLKSDGEHIGFGAQAVQKIIPEAVTKNSEGYLMVNGDPILWTMLNAIKEQQQEIEQLKGQVRQLRAARKRR
ncbi:MAG TPA: tail fiber domain-containing protein [Pyrinomonadaceae bacterium]|nr:tail fiber domain-containing protein [Pyrinomonadaceae bacterium]